MPYSVWFCQKKWRLIRFLSPFQMQFAAASSMDAQQNSLNSTHMTGLISPLASSIHPMTSLNTTMTSLNSPMTSLNTPMTSFNTSTSSLNNASPFANNAAPSLASGSGVMAHSTMMPQISSTASIVKSAKADDNPGTFWNGQSQS